MSRFACAIRLAINTQIFEYKVKNVCLLAWTGHVASRKRRYILAYNPTLLRISVFKHKKTPMTASAVIKVHDTLQTDVSHFHMRLWTHRRLHLQNWWMDETLRDCFPATRINVSSFAFAKVANLVQMFVVVMSGVSSAVGPDIQSTCVSFLCNQSFSKQQTCCFFQKRKYPPSWKCEARFCAVAIMGWADGATV